jgi:hypothetical protein
LEISGISGISAAHFRVGRGFGLAAVAEDLLGLVVVAGDARESDSIAVASATSRPCCTVSANWQCLAIH